MDDKKDINNMFLTLNDDWKSFSVDELGMVVNRAFSENSFDVREKLSGIVGEDEAFNLVARIWSTMIVQPWIVMLKRPPR
jgi:hypothetical protein